MHKELMEELLDIQRDIAEVENDLRVMETCAREGFDYNDASDYSRAVIMVSQEADAGHGAGAIRNVALNTLHNRNSIDSLSHAQYNRFIRTNLDNCRARLEDISEYGWFGDILRKIGIKKNEKPDTPK